MLTRMLIFIIIVFTVWTYANLNSPLPPTPSESSFVKIDENGSALSIWSGPWRCVYDTRTGLLWEVKTDMEDIYHAAWTFSWFLNDRGVENNGDCYFEASRCDTADLLERVNHQKLCGKNAWRLPTSDELLSLINRDVPPGEALIDKDFFPHVQRGDYWTRESEQELTSIFQHLGSGARVVNFTDGAVNVLPYRNAAFVMLVNDAPNLKK